MTTDTVRAAPEGVPMLDVEPFSDELLRDPYGYHARLREAGPVAWIPKYGVYVTGRGGSGQLQQGAAVPAQEPEP